jgi:mono/diheme cytochrome c family protein
MKNNLVLVMVVTLVAIVGMAFLPDQAKPKPWTAPAADAKKTNPVKADKAAGQALWNKHCKSCHGAKGLGDGPKAATLDTESGDFTKADFQKQSDGSLFYKTAKGRDDMPAYEKKIPDAEDIWQLVHHMRTFAK